MKLFSRIEVVIYRWLKRRRDRRILRGQASIVAAPDSGASDHSKLWANAILAAIKERKDICIHCMRPFDYWEPTQSQRFHVRAILSIPDRDLDPKLCKGCFDTAVSTFNPRYTMPGTSNSGPANLVLIDKYNRTNHG